MKKCVLCLRYQPPVWLNKRLSAPVCKFCHQKHSLKNCPLGVCGECAENRPFTAMTKGNDEIWRCAECLGKQQAEPVDPRAAEQIAAVEVLQKTIVRGHGPSKGFRYLSPKEMNGFIQRSKKFRRSKAYRSAGNKR